MQALLRSVKQRLLFKSSGEPTALLIARMRLAKFAATRGWIIPFLTVRPALADQWRQARRGDVIGYQYYIEPDSVARRLIEEVRVRSGPEDRVLDLGCNVGRDLNELWKLGYRRLTGVEIGLEPVRAMKEIFPEMAGGSRIVNKSMSEALAQFDDGEFDLVYAYGSLVSISAAEQHVFDHMCRVTARWIITIENESSWLLFPRDFGKVFTDRRMKEVHREVISNPGSPKGSFLRVFGK